MRITHHIESIEHVSLKTYAAQAISHANTRKLNIVFDQFENMADHIEARIEGNAYYHITRTKMFHLKHLTIENRDQNVHTICFVACPDTFSISAIENIPDVLTCYLPNTVKHLKVIGMNVWFTRAYIFTNLKYLKINAIAERPWGIYENENMLEYSLPALKHLEINQPYNGKYSSALRTLIVNYEVQCDRDLAHLPVSLRHLRIQNTLNYSVTFPSNLRSLFIRNTSPHSILIFPSRLKKLNIDHCVNGMSLGPLPNTLKFLRLMYYDVANLELPENSKTVLLPHYTATLNLNHLHQLKKLHIKHFHFNEVPHTIKHLHIEKCEHSLTALPERLIKLILHDYAFAFLPRLPDTLKYMEVENYKHPFNYLPSALETLIIPQVQARLPLPLPARLSHIVMAR